MNQDKTFEVMLTAYFRMSTTDQILMAFLCHKSGIAHPVLLIKQTARIFDMVHGLCKNLAEIAMENNTTLAELLAEMKEDRE